MILDTILPQWFHICELKSVISIDSRIDSKVKMIDYFAPGVRLHRYATQ